MAVQILDVFVGQPELLGELQHVPEYVFGAEDLGLLEGELLGEVVVEGSGEGGDADVGHPLLLLLLRSSYTFWKRKVHVAIPGFHLRACLMICFGVGSVLLNGCLHECLEEVHEFEHFVVGVLDSSLELVDLSSLLA